MEWGIIKKRKENMNTHKSEENIHFVIKINKLQKKKVLEILINHGWIIKHKAWVATETR